MLQTNCEVRKMNNYYKNPIFDQFNNIQVACFLDEVDVFDNEELWKYLSLIHI